MFKVKDIILAKSRRKGSVGLFLKKYKNTINVIECIITLHIIA